MTTQTPDLPINQFKRAIAQRQPQVGLWVGLVDTVCAEIAAGAGFDWLLIDGEHAPNDLRTILAQLQTIAAYPSQIIVRPPAGETHRIKQLLDIGVQTLMVPMVETAEQAAQLVSAMRYPPRGVRGVGSALARASRFNRVPSYLERADDEMCLLVQVETKRGLENIEAIARVPGVDGLFIGPADLAASLGHLGDPGHADVQNAIEDGIRRIVAAGKAAGTIFGDEAFVRRYLAMGCTFVAVGVDVSLLAQATTALANKYIGARDAAAAAAAGTQIY